MGRTAPLLPPHGLLKRRETNRKPLIDPKEKHASTKSISHLQNLQHLGLIKKLRMLALHALQLDSNLLVCGNICACKIRPEIIS
jgi:hypothetical protein